MKSDSKGHIVELQSLRGIAAVAVMIGHSLAYFRPPQWFAFWANGYLLFNGRAAVVIFFVLSGYVLTLSLRRSDLSLMSLGKYYFRRFFRIYPAIWFASILGLLYLFFLHWRIPVPEAGEGVLHQFRTDRMDILHIAASFAGMLAFILPQLWSITVEIFASLLMPFVAFVAFRKHRAFIAWLGITIILSFAVGNRTYYNFVLYYPDFVIGAGIAILPPLVTGWIYRNARAARYVLLASALLIIPTQFLPLPYYNPLAALVEAVLASTIIILLVYSSEPPRFLRRKIMLWIGDISYSIYLVHYVVICTLAKIVSLAFQASSLRHDTLLLPVIMAILVPVITIPLAWLSYNYIELPGIALGRWLTSQMRVGQAFLRSGAR